MTCHVKRRVTRFMLQNTMEMLYWKCVWSTVPIWHAMWKCYLLYASKYYWDVILEKYTINAVFACNLGELGCEFKVQDNTAMLTLGSVITVLIVLPGQSAITHNHFASSSASWLKLGLWVLTYISIYGPAVCHML